MDHFDTDRMNQHDADYSHNSHVHNVDASRAPQLNSRVPGHGALDQGRQDMGSGDDDVDGSNNSTDGEYIGDAYEDYDSISDDAVEHVEGQEGLENGQIRGTRHSPFTLAIFMQALARHETRNGYRAALMGEHITPEPSTPILPGMWSPSSSVQAEYGGGSNGNTNSDNSSGNRSMESSSIWSHPNRSSTSVVALTGTFEGPTFQAPPACPNFVSVPLPLNPQFVFAREMHRSFHYPCDMSIPEDDGSDEEINWFLP